MINKHLFNQLLNHNSRPAVSLYIPTNITGDYVANKIRWQNAIRDAKSRLIEKDIVPRDADAVLKPAHDLLSDDDFWSHQSNGLAGFYSNEVQEYFHLAIKPKEQVYVNDRFLVSPLMPTLMNEQVAWILAITREEVRFYEAYRHAIIPIKINDLVPSDMKSVTRLDNPSDSLQHHTISGDAAAFHGQGAGGDVEEHRLMNYLNAIDKGLQPIFANDSTPLILAAGSEIQGLYRKVSDYNYISDYKIALNPSASDAIALHSEIVPFFKKRRKAMAENLNKVYEYKKAQHLGGSDLTEAIEHARYKNLSDVILPSNMAKLSREETLKIERVLRNAYASGSSIHFVDSDTLDDDPIRYTMRASLHTADM